MSKIMPYLKTALTVIAILVVYKLIAQPTVQANATLSKYLPSV